MPLITPKKYIFRAGWTSLIGEGGMNCQVCPLILADTVRRDRFRRLKRIGLPAQSYLAAMYIVIRPNIRMRVPY